MNRTVDGSKLHQARVHMATVANNLALALGPVAAGELLLGASLGLIEHALGADKAAEYLRGVADEIEADESWPSHMVGHA